MFNYLPVCPHWRVSWKTYSHPCCCWFFYSSRSIFVSYFYTFSIFRRWVSNAKNTCKSIGAGANWHWTFVIVCRLRKIRGQNHIYSQTSVLGLAPCGFAGAVAVEGRVIWACWERTAGRWLGSTGSPRYLWCTCNTPSCTKQCIIIIHHYTTFNKNMEEALVLLIKHVVLHLQPFCVKYIKCKLCMTFAEPEWIMVVTWCGWNLCVTAKHKSTF
jgi:hypothetical protein